MRNATDSNVIPKAMVGIVLFVQVTYSSTESLAFQTASAVPVTRKVYTLLPSPQPEQHARTFPWAVDGVGHKVGASFRSRG